MKTKMTTAVIYSFLMLFISCGEDKAAKEDPSKTRALELLSQMTLDEKVNQMSGGPHQVTTISMMTQIYNDRLNIPSMVFSDGTRGAKSMTTDMNYAYTTVFPVASLRAASFDRNSERLVGEISALETSSLGNYVLCAPNLNQTVNPRYGRSQESYGEDSYLIGEMASSHINGTKYSGAADEDNNGEPDVDENGKIIYYDAEGRRSYAVQSVISEFTLSGNENARYQLNALADERTLREVFLPQFKKAIDKADPAGVMSAYNMVNGDYCASNKELMSDILYGEWGFEGYTVTQWYGKAESTEKAVEAQLSIEMPYSKGVSDFEPAYGGMLVSAVKYGKIPEESIDKIVLRILERKIAYGMLDHGRDFSKTYTIGEEDEYHAYQSAYGLQRDESVRASLEIARRGIVLLKDGSRSTESSVGGFLPLDSSSGGITAERPAVMLGQYSNIARTGDMCTSNAFSSPMGASLDITPYQGFSEFLGEERVKYFTGNRCPDYYDYFCAVNHEEYGDEEALNALKTASWAIVVCSYIPPNLAKIESEFDNIYLGETREEGETADRSSLSLHFSDLSNIQAAVEARTGNPDLKIMVIIESGSAVLVEGFVDEVDVIVQAWYPGMCGGQAIAELVFGQTLELNMWTDEPQEVRAVSFSGKSPVTWPRSDEQLPFYPSSRQTTEYNYGYYHGYRLFEQGLAGTEEKSPRYWFGYGLSYNTYSYSNLEVDSDYVNDEGTRLIRVSVDVTNNGEFDSSEIVQAYVGFKHSQLNDSWGRPVKQLFGFDRVDIAAGETEKAVMYIEPSDLAYWNEASQSMVIEDIQYELIVSESSDPDARKLTSVFRLY